MTITQTVYPPAGATALLAAVNPQIERLGWFLIPLILLSAALTLVVSLLINNVQRQYPTYWWTPAKLGKIQQPFDIEKTTEHQSSGRTSQASLRETTDGSEGTSELIIKITPHSLVIPDHIFLAGEEKDILQVLQERLEGLG